MAFTNSSSSSQDNLPNRRNMIPRSTAADATRASSNSSHNSNDNDIDNDNDNDYNNQEFNFNMDGDDFNEDYKELRQSLIARRESFRETQDQIQQFNYSNSPVLKLPSEVLLQIFHYLERKDLFALLTVCREFANLIIEILWFRPNMQNDVAFKKIRSIMELPKHSTHWDYRSFIKRLNLSFMTKLVDDSLLLLFIGCPKLERLTLVNCTKLSHVPITSVLENCEKLQSIDLTGVQDIHDDIIYALSRNCTRLQGLYAPGCGSVSEDAILTLLRSCSMLKRVKFNNSDHITDESIIAMYTNCKSLVEIDLHNCPNVSDKYLKQIFADLSQLREFRISNAAGITDKLFELIPEDHYLEKLRIIDITGCNAITDRLVEKLVKCAPRLRNVVLSKCMQITDASLRALALLGRSLHYVHLGHCGLITDFGVQSLVRSCHRIQYIDLACCSQLTDWTLIELATLPKLRRIGLVKCNLITDGGILELVRRRGEQDCLERVHLSYCTNLTIGPIYLLLKNCPKLTHLSLTGIASFLRREITQYCREPPPDFNEYQRTSFCVFSGQGVNRLRDHLNRVMEDRAYLIEHGDFNNAIDRRRRANNTTNQFTDAVRPPANNLIEPDVLNVNNLDADMNNENDRVDERVRMVMIEEMNAWAARRGLGLLQSTDASASNEDMEQVHREIFRELAEGNMPPDQMREHFQSLIRNYYRNRRWVEEANQQADDGLENTDNEANQSIHINSAQTTNAPQIVQPAVFPGGAGVNNNDEDVDMEPVDLFPRNQNSTN